MNMQEQKMAMQDLYNLDASARERIAHETDRSFFVEASAGSGKTTMLVARMTAMIEHGADIRTLCAITFTKNAANEFYSRFRKALTDRSYDSALQEEKRQRFLYALQNIDLCFMGTIDSFCQTVLQEHPMEAGIPSDSVLVTPDRLAALGRAELTRAANGAYGENLQNLYRLLDGMLPAVDAVILRYLNFFLETRDTEMIFEPLTGTDFERDNAAEIAEIRRTLAILSAHPEYCYTGKTVKKTGEFKPTATAVAARDALGSVRHAVSRNWNRSLKTVIPALNKLKNLRLQYAPEKIGLADSTLFAPHNDKCEWYDCTIAESGHLLAGLDEERYSVFMAFMTEFSRLAAAEIRRSGNLTFYDAQLCLLEMLRRDLASDGRLLRHIAQRHRYFLIDEFQDTSPMQAEIFFLLAAEAPQADWRLCVPRPGSLFIVGDPKQSIYRFRNADVSSYLEVKRFFRPPLGETLSLYRNFRSRPQLCRQFNTLYSRLLPEETAEQSRFEDIPISGKADDSAGELCGMYFYRTDKDSSVDAEVLAGLIRRLVGNPEVQIPDNGKMRTLAWKDIMVITRGKKQLNTYLSVCSKYGIPVFVEGMTVFSECPALVAASQVLDALADPGKKQAVYAALKSGLFDITDDLLSRCCRTDGVSLRNAGDEALEAFPQVQSALQKLNRLALSARNDSPAAILNRVLTDLDVFARRGVDHLEYIPFALELLRRGETDGTISNTSEAAAYVHALITDQSEIERSLNLTGEPDCVHFANLHKVKGLEAPVVILAEPKTERAHAVHSRTERSGDRRVSYLFDVMSEGFGAALSTKRYEDKKKEEKASCAAEELRLLYVAGTRARNILITAQTPENNHFWVPILPECGRDISSALGETGMPAVASENFTPEDAATIAACEGMHHRESCIHPGFTVRLPSHGKVPTRLQEENGETDETEAAEDVDTAGISAGAETEEKSGEPGKTERLEQTGQILRNDADSAEKTSRADARLIGTMIHRMMEMLVSSRNSVEADTMAHAIAAGYTCTEQERKHYEELLSTAAGRIRSGGFPQTNGVTQDILSETLLADEVYCELPFCYREGDTVWHGSMDLVYRIGDRWHIVDYKTNADPDDLDQKYCAQLAAYQRAFYELNGCTATVGTYHISY